MSYKPRTITHKNAEWEWNTATLNSRIEQTTNPKDCWEWQGNKGPQGNLFGAYKRGRSQVTQANRLIYAEHNPDIILTDVEVKMTCHNKWCCNHNHMTAIKKKSITDRSTRLKLAHTKKKQRLKDRYIITISEHVFTMLEVEERYELRDLVQEFAYDAGTNWEFEYRWFKISKEKHLLATMKYPQIQKYLTVKEM